MCDEYVCIKIEIEVEYHSKISSLLARVFLLEPPPGGGALESVRVGVGSCELCSVSVEVCAREWSRARESVCARGRQQGSERERERLVRRRERRKAEGGSVHLVIVCVSLRSVCIGATCRIERVESGERGAGSVQRAYGERCVCRC